MKNYAIVSRYCFWPLCTPMLKNYWPQWRGPIVEHNGVSGSGRNEPADDLEYERECSLE